MLERMAYITNWLIVLIGYVLLISSFLIPIEKGEDIWVYETGFSNPLVTFFFAIMFGLFASALALVIQINYLILLSLLLLFSPFLLIVLRVIFVVLS
ncbi:hypothetical protein [Marinococcus sp. PL1-022]|uniref:hypothetical protein n=1 Tax=Marinococcus sp. PL1-022 TaxID=3095363 RepID=UPI0029C47703|nr:hypothetical protein [Marinococcus sp. PL1-022]MDX6152662.1 hypothetical protein [Marinococcus sp. PL1-022]